MIPSHSLAVLEASRIFGPPHNMSILPWWNPYGFFAEKSSNSSFWLLEFQSCLTHNNSGAHQKQQPVCSSLRAAPRLCALPPGGRTKITMGWIPVRKPGVLKGWADDCNQTWRVAAIPSKLGKLIHESGGFVNIPHCQYRMIPTWVMMALVIPAINLRFHLSVCACGYSACWADAHAAKSKMGPVAGASSL